MGKVEQTIKIRDIWCPDVDHIHLIPLFDIQMGNKECDEEALKAYVSYIAAEPNRRSCGGGDWVECHMLNNKALDLSEFTMPLKEAKMAVAKDVAPIIDKIDAAVGGNHEGRVTRASGDEPVFDILRFAGLSDEEAEERYDNDIMLVRYHVGKSGRTGRPILYRGLIAHGWGGARSVGAHINKVEEWFKVFPALDFAINGHEHDTSHSEPGYLDIPAQGKTVNRKKRLAISSPSLCDWTRFERGKAIRIPNIGAANIRLDGKRRDIHVNF